MTTPHSRSHLPEPLTSEERELAARLSQLGPHGTPPPALDAGIIAAAHAAAVGQARRPRQGRWPALLGLAATLALAIGVTWQLQPGAEVASRDEAPRERASAVADEAAADSAEPTVGPVRQEPRLADDVAPSGDEAVPMRKLAPTAAEPEQAPAAVPGRAQPAARAMPAPPLPLPQPAPPAAPPAPAVPEQAGDAATPARVQRETTLARRMPESRAEAKAAPALIDRAVPAAGAEAVDASEWAAVPVARDSELEPADWLERIRLRRDASNLAGARESLQLLRRAHPQVVLPDDLRELADGHLDQP